MKELQPIEGAVPRGGEGRGEKRRVKEKMTRIVMYDWNAQEF